MIAQYEHILEAQRLANLVNRRFGDSALQHDVMKLAKDLLDPSKQARAALVNIQYSKALELIYAAEMVVSSVSELSSYTLPLQRLRVVAEAGKLAMHDKQSLSKVIEPIVDLLEALLELKSDNMNMTKVRGNWQALEAKLNDMGWSPATPSRQLVSALGAEVAFHVAWMDYKRASLDLSLAKATESLKQVVDSLGIDEDRRKHPYGDCLLKQLGLTPHGVIELYGQYAQHEKHASEIAAVRQIMIGDIKVGDYWEAHEHLRKNQEERLGGIGLLHHDIELFKILDQTAQLLHWTRQAIEDQEWHALLARRTGHIDKLLGHRQDMKASELSGVKETIRRETREGFENVIKWLKEFDGDPALGHRWYKVNSPKKITEIEPVMKLLRDWRNDDPLHEVMGWTTGTGRP